VGQAIVFCGLPTQTTKNDRLRHHVRGSVLSRRRLPYLAVFAAVVVLALGHSAAGQTAPSPSLWQPLFDGKSLAGWKETPFTDHGAVSVENGTLVFGVGTLTGVTWTGNFPQSNFEVRWEAMKLEGGDFFSGFTFPVGDSFCTWIVGGWGGGTVGLSNVDGWDASSNQTYQWRNFDANHWYALRIRVTDQRIQAWIDDQEYVNLALAGRVINLRYGEIKLSAPLGFASYGTKAALRNMEYRPLTAAEKK
jgi:hypothetical protein